MEFYKKYKNTKMQFSNKLSKNIIILTIVLFALIAALNVMLLLDKNPVSSPAPAVKGITSAAINKNINELDSFDADLALFAGDDAVTQELNAILSEMDETKTGSIESTVSVNLTDDEKSLNDLSKDLDTSSSDEATDRALNEALEEAAL